MITTKKRHLYIHSYMLFLSKHSHARSIAWIIRITWAVVIRRKPAYTCMLQTLAWTTVVTLLHCISTTCTGGCRRGPPLIPRKKFSIGASLQFRCCHQSSCRIWSSASFGIYLRLHSIWWSNTLLVCRINTLGIAQLTFHTNSWCVPNLGLLLLFLHTCLRHLHLKFYSMKLHFIIY